jgi:hypothetical protein
MLILTDVQKVTLSVAPVSKAGNPAVLDGAPKWTVSDETVLTVAVAEDGLSAVVSSTGKIGKAQVSVLADADIGEGVTELAGVLDIEVKASAAVSMGLEAGTPVEKE